LEYQNLFQHPRSAWNSDRNISQTVEGLIRQVDAKALSVEAKGSSLKSLDPLHDGRRCSWRPMAPITAHRAHSEAAVLLRCWEESIEKTLGIMVVHLSACTESDAR
jgi:hypothetical protein